MEYPSKARIMFRGSGVAVLMTDSVENLRIMMEHFYRICLKMVESKCSRE